MKTFGKTIAWLVVIGIISSVFYFTVFEKKVKEPVKEVRTVNKEFENFIWSDYNRVIGLLSMKYNISETIIKDIAVEYLRINNPEDYVLLTSEWEKKDTTVYDHLFEPKESVQITVNKLSEKYGIKSDLMSTILFDFELWNNIHHKNSGDEY